MYHRILIVAGTEGFIIKGLENKLKGIGIEQLYSSFRMSDIKNMCDNTDLIIIFTGDDILIAGETLGYIKDRRPQNPA
ncbi:MAG: hypothetical protein K6G58_00750 [Lachnospiraceae bacterium]|nr:hypothetical protein [Lachnospiraceae bacterium]